MDLPTIVLPVAALVVGVVAGVLIGRRRSEAVDPEAAFAQPEAAVPEGVAELLAMQDSASIVIGPHDEVLEATTAARNLGLVRGTRVTIPELLDLVREVRRDRAQTVQELQIRRGSRATTTYLVVHIGPLAEDLIVVLADDQTTARRVEETRRDFIVNTSHELKTPIGAISLLAEAVEDAADDPPAVRRFASRLGIESARLADLAGQIIELSRLQSDNPLTRPEVVDVDEVLADAVDRSRVDADRRGLTLTIAGTSGRQVLGNARQLGVAVGNLVENAVIYSDDGARVTVAAHQGSRGAEDSIEITVSDNGIGIAPAEHARIFERFYRVDYGRSRAHGGTGLGLSIVSHIAAAHGGSVAVWSQPGRGSTFTLRLPAHLAAVDDPTADASQNAGAELDDGPALDVGAGPDVGPSADQTARRELRDEDHDHQELIG